jgi:hypothetical protein
MFNHHEETRRTNSDQLHLLIQFDAQTFITMNTADLRQTQVSAQLSAPTPPTPRSTPELSTPEMWSAIFDLQMQMHYLLRKLDQLEAQLHEENATRTIWLPNVFLANNADPELPYAHTPTAITAGQSWDVDEWDEIVKKVIGECN